VSGSAVDDEERRFLDATLPHIDAIYNIARRMAPDAATAEDLVQETYLRAFKGFAGFRGGSSRSWLVAICLNTARSDVRRRQARPYECFDVDLSDAPDDADTCGQAIRALDNAELYAALDELAEPTRVCIVLCDLGGLTAQETADALGCPRGTVLARVHRGRRQLASRLEHLEVRREL
jgi:RNA polymerase sigma-70 factor (ECF subfamily)